LEFVAGRARPNTVRANTHDLCVIFSVVDKDPRDVRAKDVLGFVTEQRRARTGGENVLRISDGQAGLCGNDQATPGCGPEPVWLPNHTS